MSRPSFRTIVQNEMMLDQVNGELRFNTEFCARIKRLRTERGLTAAEMGTALGIPAERYRKYENRSPLPAYLMTKFCMIVNCDLDHLIAGRRRHRNH